MSTHEHTHPCIYPRTFFVPPTLSSAAPGCCISHLAQRAPLTQALYRNSPTATTRDPRRHYRRGGNGTTEAAVLPDVKSSEHMRHPRIPVDTGNLVYAPQRSAHRGRRAAVLQPAGRWSFQWICADNQRSCHAASRPAPAYIKLPPTPALSGQRIASCAAVAPHHLCVAAARGVSRDPLSSSAATGCSLAAATCRGSAPSCRPTPSTAAHNPAVGGIGGGADAYTIPAPPTTSRTTPPARRPLSVVCSLCCT